MQPPTTPIKDCLSYSPINKAHSIVETVFFIQFNKPFSDSTKSKLIAIGDDLKDQLPKSNLINKTAFKFDMSALNNSSVNEIEVVGIELQKTNDDGSLSWMLRIAEDIISVHCLDYTRWDDVWEKAKYYLNKSREHIGGRDNFISCIGLRYIDRFCYNGKPNESNLKELFKSNFMWKLFPTVKEPFITLASDGEINFLWILPNFRLDLGIYGDGSYSYYGKTSGGEEFIADETPIDENLPEEILALITNKAA